ncbi:hypothetical protein [uncultured Brachyspira sp.]|uniref:hypothetical protein n=1 Tax=uncultured Brachyspira sp. TaxID=221953 RepID=UPI00259BB604|nr:hypothetical protein [uncultured Brachyspira sp.]
MKKIIFFISILFIFISCSNELITVVDEYNPPYGIKAIPGNNSISISFWSGILASDFVGFNIYIKQGNSSFTQPTDAIKNSLGGYPTVANSTHTRTNFTIQVPPTQTGQTYQNGTLYYVTVTAYGTNDLTDTKYIETKINAIVPVIPRMEGDGTGNTITANSQTVGTIDKTQNLVTASGGWKLQYFGPQSDFNAVVVITNNNFPKSDNAYSVNGFYIFSNGQNGLAKVHIISSSSHRWAYHDKANLWLGI